MSSGIPELQSPRVLVGNSQFQSFNYYNYCFFLCNISRCGRKSRRGQSEMPAILVSHKAAVGCQKKTFTTLSCPLLSNIHAPTTLCVCLSLWGFCTIYDTSFGPSKHSDSLCITNMCHTNSKSTIKRLFRLFWVNSGPGSPDYRVKVDHICH